jgi:hypothetical protein
MFNDYLIQYESAVEQITIYFAKKYFGKHYMYSASDWVGEEIGGTIFINDYCFDIDTMLHYLKYKYSVDKMFEHYDYALDERTKEKSPICIRDWKKLTKNK